MKQTVVCGILLLPRFNLDLPWECVGSEKGVFGYVLYKFTSTVDMASLLDIFGLPWVAPCHGRNWRWEGCLQSLAENRMRNLTSHQLLGWSWMVIPLPKSLNAWGLRLLAICIGNKPIFVAHGRFVGWPSVVKLLKGRCHRKFPCQGWGLEAEKSWRYSSWK